MLSGGLDKPCKDMATVENLSRIVKVRASRHNFCLYWQKLFTGNYLLMSESGFAALTFDRKIGEKCLFNSNFKEAIVISAIPFRHGSIPKYA